MADNVGGIGVEARGDRLTLAKRRQLGLTLGEIGPVVAKLLKSGAIERTESAATVAAAVAAELHKTKPQACEGLAAADWDTILAFIEKLVPLIMALLSLWGL